MERGKWSGGYLNNFSLSTASPLKGGNEWSGESCGIAEVVASTPTRSIFSPSSRIWYYLELILVVLDEKK
jgi:hypothetical protein